MAPRNCIKCGCSELLFNPETGRCVRQGCCCPGCLFELPKDPGLSPRAETNIAQGTLTAPQGTGTVTVHAKDGTTHDGDGNKRMPGDPNTVTKPAADLGSGQSTVPSTGSTGGKRATAAKPATGKKVN